MPACTHLDQVTVSGPDDVAGWAAGFLSGGRWVHLRVCRSCGHVGCCDSSPNRHATHHAQEAKHPIITSVEPGEDWSYCYLDDTMFELEGDHA
jgi:hypothetical protein